MKIYSCVSDDILTDEVIITTNQIRHIKERHPGDYEKFGKHIGEIIADPDYILEANKPHTAFVLKEVTEAGKKFELILRLKTSTDPRDNRNSVITFLKVDEKEWSRLVRNKKVLYKRE